MGWVGEGGVEFKNVIKLLLLSLGLHPVDFQLLYCEMLHKYWDVPILVAHPMYNINTKLSAIHHAYSWDRNIAELLLKLSSTIIKTADLQNMLLYEQNSRQSAQGHLIIVADSTRKHQVDYILLVNWNYLWYRIYMCVYISYDF